MTLFTAEIEALAKDWFRRCRESQMVHYEYASVLERRHLYFGIPAIVLSAVVGTAIFSTWQSAATHTGWQILFGLLSMAAAAISALQTFLNLSERAAKHKSAGAGYGAVRRELELLKSLPPADEEGIRAALLAIKEQMDELAANSPSIPSAFKARIDAHLKSQSHDRIYQLGPPGPGTPG